jgi:Uma2 family endonuclease
MVAEAVDLRNLPPLTVEEFEALARERGWDEDTRVELLDGEVVRMSPVGNPHAGCVNRLTRLFYRRYPGESVLVSVQNPIHPSQNDEPLPDVVLLKPRPDDYSTAAPVPPDILLLVEVSDSTLLRDLGRKARIYASAGIQEYWVVDLNGERVYVHRQPDQGTYQDRTVAARGEHVSTLFAADVRLAVDEIFG